MPGKKMKKGVYEMNHPNMMKPSYEMNHPNMMKPAYEMGHSPKEMKDSPMPMRGHGKTTKAGRPVILKHMSS